MPGGEKNSNKEPLLNKDSVEFHRSDSTQHGDVFEDVERTNSMITVDVSSNHSHISSGEEGNGSSRLQVVIEKKTAGKGTSRNAFINFTKGMFGAGVLALAHGWSMSGFVGGIVTYLLVAAICTYSMLLTLTCMQEAQAQQAALPKAEQRKALVTYSQLAGVSLGKGGEYVINCVIVAMECLFCKK